jgi:proline racemase
VIALGKWAVDARKVDVPSDATSVEVRMHVPCGVVVATVTMNGGLAGAVSFVSVPAFAVALDVPIKLPTPRLEYATASRDAGVLEVSVDVAFGGAFFAFAKASDFGLDVRESTVRALVDAADAVTAAVKEVIPITHPDSDALAYYYGTILTDGGTGAQDASCSQVCGSFLP